MYRAHIHECAMPNPVMRKCFLLTLVNTSAFAAVTAQRVQECAGADAQLYLAQAPLSHGLAPLLGDLPTPPALRCVDIRVVNLWMNNTPSTSSLHYDPQHNLLCVIVGSKRVRLWPPVCTPLLHPFSAFGESPNHSTLTDLGASDALAAATSLAERKGGRYFEVQLAAGDALLIPAGWWHLVRSQARTVAINYWWPASDQLLAARSDSHLIDKVHGGARCGLRHMHVFFERQHARAAAETLLHASLTRCRQRVLCRSGCGNARGIQPQVNTCVVRRLRIAVLCMQTYMTQPPVADSTDEQQNLRQMQGDAMALLLCDDATESVALLCSCAKDNAQAVRHWLHSGMSSLCAECFTLLMEGGWAVLAAGSDAGASSAANAWLKEPDWAWFDQVRAQCAPCDSGPPVETLREAQGVTECNAVNMLFARVYAVADADVVAQSLSERKEALRASAANAAPSLRT